MKLGKQAGKQFFVLVAFVPLLLLGCKPDTAKPSIATPEMPWSPLATPSSPEARSVQTLSPGIPPAVDNIWAVPPQPVTPMPLEADAPRSAPPQVTPLPTPTLFPDNGVRMSALIETRPITGKWTRWFTHGFNGHDLVGVAHNDSDSAVILVDMEIGQTKVITTSQAWISVARISGNNVVWLVSKDRNYLLYRYDLQASQTSFLTEGVYRDLDLSNTIAVMCVLAPTGDNWDIWGYDLLQQKMFPVVTKPGTQFGPKISGRWVVYQDATDKDEVGIGLYAINLDTGKDIRLGSVYAASDQYVPLLYTIDAPWVVWSTGQWSKQPELHFYNLDAGSAYTITVASCSFHEQPGRPQNLLLSGSILIFSGCYQDLGYDIERKAFFSLPTYTSDMQGSSWVGWAMSGDRLVWTRISGPSGQEESRIYTAQIVRDK